MKKRSLHTVGNSLTGMSVGSFRVSEGNKTWRGEKIKKNAKDTLNHNCREVAQTLLVSTTGEWGLVREAWTESLVFRVRTAPEEMHVPQCSLQHCVQQLGHGSNLYIQKQMNG